MTTFDLTLRRPGGSRAIDRAGFPHVGECLGSAGWRPAMGISRHDERAATASVQGAATT